MPDHGREITFGYFLIPDPALPCSPLPIGWRSWSSIWWESRIIQVRNVLFCVD